MKDDAQPTTASWRSVALTFTDIGRNLAIIEAAIRDINATAVVSNAKCALAIENAWRAAKILVREFDALRDKAR